MTKDEQDEFRGIVRAFVSGMLEAFEGETFEVRDEAAATIAAALFNEAIAICIARGVETPMLMRCVEEHVAEVSAACAAQRARGAN